MRFLLKAAKDGRGRTDKPVEVLDFLWGGWIGDGGFQEMTALAVVVLPNGEVVSRPIDRLVRS